MVVTFGDALSCGSGAELGLWRGEGVNLFGGGEAYLGGVLFGVMLLGCFLSVFAVIVFSDTVSPQKFRCGTF